MKVYPIAVIVFLHLSAVSGSACTTKESSGPVNGSYCPDIDEPLSPSAQTYFQPWGDIGETMGACDKRDCKQRYYFNETLRWVKKALVDAGVLIHENPKATAALLVGVSVLAADLIISGDFLPAVLEVAGIDENGPLPGSIAEMIQRKIAAANVGPVFAQLLSAAMGGAPLHEIEEMAKLAFPALSAVGVSNLVEAGSKPLGEAKDFDRAEWKAWEDISRVDYTPEPLDKMSRLWGVAKAGSCVEYGYREYRAPIWFIPDGGDPMSMCLQTPATIQGISFKSPLGCADQGPKKGVMGTWYVQSNETVCLPHWSQFEDEGCVQYGIRRMFARLLELRRQDDWNSMCASTPAYIRNKIFNRPTYCEDKGIRGIFGIFDVPDEKCKCYCVGR
ncbi:hypothetical protein BDV93DRAFT_603956 [Ceratobasidium sp. AG-I]|nr:hypothetical protein BDV93DRAFT_603956 [Ceratobasidium sp. AG-I]